MNKAHYIFVIGYSGAGKTTFCEFLSKASNMRVINSGKALRNFLATRGVTVDRKELTGETFLSLFDEVKLAKVLFASAEEIGAHIIDGVRLPSTLSYFKQLRSIRTFTIFVESDIHLRVQRMEKRSVIESPDPVAICNQAELYLQELQILRTMSDIVICNNNNLNELELVAFNTWGRFNRKSYLLNRLIAQNPFIHVIKFKHRFHYITRDVFESIKHTLFYSLVLSNNYIIRIFRTGIVRKPQENGLPRKKRMNPNSHT
jgi:dephospho-CoA kinase